MDTHTLTEEEYKEFQIFLKTKEVKALEGELGKIQSRIDFHQEKITSEKEAFKEIKRTIRSLNQQLLKLQPKKRTRRTSKA